MLTCGFICDPKKPWEGPLEPVNLGIPALGAAGTWPEKTTVLRTET